jgi:ribonuclease VapC
MSASTLTRPPAFCGGRHGGAAVARFYQWLIDDEIEVVAFDEVQVRAAAVAFDRSGKGIANAGLNPAHCAAYAPARTMNCPLLLKGNDFTETDVKACP